MLRLGAVAARRGAWPAGADRDAGLEIAFRLHRYWAATNVAEGHFWLSRLLDGQPTPSGRATRPTRAGYLSYWAGDAEPPSPSCDRGRATPRRRRLLPARALIFLGGLADDLDRGADAIEYVRQAIEAAAPYGVDLQVSAAMGMACLLGRTH